MPRRSLLLPLALAALLAGCASDTADRGPDADAPRTPATGSSSGTSDPAPTSTTGSGPAPALPPSAAEPAQTPAPALPAGPMEITVPILDAAFPPLIALPVGSTVTWKNLDDEAHSVLSSDAGFSGAAYMPPGTEFVRTFLAPGEYAFACRYHDGMSGLLVIS